MFFIGLQQLCHQTNTNYTIAMKRNLTLLLLLGSAALFAQTNIKLEGTLFDQKTNQPLSEKTFVVEGLNIQAKTDDKGHYEISVPDDTYQLDIKVDGYQSVSQNLSDSNTLNMYLKPEDFKDGKIDLETAVVTANKIKSSEASLLNVQKKSVTIVQNVGSQELSRKGLSNAESAIQQVTGISKSEGKGGVFVRGLGDRYNSTMLNGLPLPSNEPENKNISLDLFGSDIIQSVGVNKVYNVDLYGDIGGANVDISSKLYEGKGFLDIEFGSGVSMRAVDRTFKVANNLKYYGFNRNNLPTSIKSYQFVSRWSPDKSAFPVNQDYGLTGGKSFNVGSQGKLNVFGTASFSNSYTYEDGFQRVVGTTNDNIEVDYFKVKKYEYSTKTTGMLNVNYKINPKHQLFANGIMVNGSKSSVNEYDSYLPQDNRYEFTRQTLTEQNLLLIGQLLGKHQLSDRLDIDWGASYNLVHSDMPDRITNNLIHNDGDNYAFNTGSPTTNNRYFQYIDETEYAGKAILSYKLFKNAENDYNGKLTIGYNGRKKSRDFESNQFNFRISGDVKVNPNKLDDFLNGDNQASSPYIPGTFFINTQRMESLVPYTYNGDLTVHSGFANFEQTINDNFTYSLGVRVDKVLQEIEWDTNYPMSGVKFSDADIDKTFILPALNIKYSLDSRQNLRLSASKTYTLPQFKEKAPFRYEGIGENSVGNPFLNSSDNYNLDIKWELFPSSNEILSFGAFGKFIQNPISQVLLNSALNDNTFVNAGENAYVFGAELEVRKNLIKNVGHSELSAGFNATVMYSKQKLDSDKVAEDTKNTLSVNFNEKEDKLQGASPLLLNADLSYKVLKGNFKPSFTLIGNYFHDRVYSLGSFERGNIIEKGVVTLNFISRAEIGDRWEMKLSVDNLLNSKIRRIQDNQQGEIDTRNFRKGLDVSLGVKYKIFK
ncbi:TonB-dependent receptor [Empedobacter falsenii]|uniref:TonB-dependent receptor n=1 Tax=Empedobacter falsenii TaxID=343874 RepID=A0A3R8ZA85_9FLAO|nr:TonB-dependent receptor [Empedobacter falsenii]RRT94045.1 TonB-dependent receptor [Empedobacter falsenii]RRT94239.1 TonB-dependent receptor [Empedobacter falsenii]